MVGLEPRKRKRELELEIEIGNVRADLEACIEREHQG
jgi:hypothetical protein